MALELGVGKMSVDISNNVEQIEFTELGFPGVEIVPTIRGSILHATRASQLPYSAKSIFPLCYFQRAVGQLVMNQKKQSILVHSGGMTESSSPCLPHPRASLRLLMRLIGS